MVVFTINRYAQHINGQQLIHRFKHILDQTCSNIPVALPSSKEAENTCLLISNTCSKL